MVDAESAVRVLDRDSHPDVRRPGKDGGKFNQSLGSLGKDLIAVPSGPVHSVKDLMNEIQGHLFVKEVAHGVDEHHLRLLPSERQSKHAGMEGDLEPAAIIRLAHSLETEGHALGVAVLAAGACFCAPRDRVPRGLGPLDGGVHAHSDVP